MGKSKKRKDAKYPNLKPELNTKKRRFYMDQHHYVNGVKHNGIKVMPELCDNAKEFLDTFNNEYYNASFKESWNYSEIHTLRVDKDTVEDIKQQIRDIKKLRSKIWKKSANVTTEEDRELARQYSDQIEEMEQFLFKVHPRMELERDNYRRQWDIINHGRASNEIDLVSWETLDDNMLSDLDPEFYVQNFEDED